jgi:hypothetical protein
MGNDAKKYQFPAAIGLIVVCLAYIFLTIWHKPISDQSAAVLGIIMLLIGYYWGSSKTSQERSEMQTRMDSGITPIQQAQADKIVAEIEQPKLTRPFGPLK